MKFLILSTDYTGQVFYDRLTKERHDVKLFKTYHKDNGVPLIYNIAQAGNWKPDVTICATPYMQEEVQALTKMGLNILGGNKLQSELELNKESLAKFCKTFGIRFLKETTKKWFPLSVEIWFINGEPIYQYFGYIKQTKFLAGDLGVDTDCESIIFWSYKDRSNQAIERIFGNGLFDFLKSIKYTGPFAVDTYISKDDLYPYIYKMYLRFQAPSLLSLLSLHTKDISFLILCMISKDETSILLDDKISISCKLSLPPYPYNVEGFLKYMTVTGDGFYDTRSTLISLIQEEKICDIPNIQFRVDAGKQGEWLKNLYEIY